MKALEISPNKAGKHPEKTNFRRAISIGKLSAFILASAAIVSCSGENAEAPISNKHGIKQEMNPKKDTSKFDETDWFLTDTSFYSNAVITEKNGFTLVMEKPGYEKGALEMADVVFQANMLLPEQRRVVKLVLRNRNSFQVEGETVGTGMRYYDCGIYGLLDITVEMPRHKMSTFHEYSHCFFETEELDTITMQKAYELMMKSANVKLQGDSVYQMGRLMTYYLETHNLISLFDESSYLKKYGFSYGHPYDEPCELFASGSAILKFMHIEFFSRLKPLWKDDPVAAAIARRIARAIVQTWGDVCIFPTEVYRKLNLDAPKKH